MAVRPPYFIIVRTAKPSFRRRPVNSTLGPRKDIMRRSVILVAAAALVAISIAAGNYFLVHRDMGTDIAADPRNAGLVLYGYHDKLVTPGTITIDLRDVSATNSPADVFRLAASSLNCNTSSPDEVPRWKIAGATRSSRPRNEW